MNIKRTLATLVAAVGLLFNGAGPVAAVSDYPPSGPVVVVSGDLVAGGTAQAAVENCIVGEAVRTTIASMPTVESTCERVDVPEATSGAVPARGVAQFDLPLPAESGLAAGEARLLDSGHTLSFALDVRSEVSAAAVEPISSGRAGWPFLLLAGLIVFVVMVVVSRRRTADDTP